jgi:hypothetical protein
MTMPAPQLEINTYSGWTDFSNRLVMRSGILAKRGRATQFDTSSPGTLSFTLNNSNNLFTPGTNAYGITKNTEVRLTISGSQVWAGYIDSMTTTIAAGYDQVVVFNATDKFKFFSKRLLSSYGIEKAHDLVGAYSAGATYALQGPRNGVGSFWQAFRDTAASPIRIYSGTGGAAEFTDDGPPFATPCIRLKPNTNAIGPVLEHPTSFNPGTENAVVSFWFKTNAQEPPNDIYLMDMRRTSGGTGYTSIKLESATGKLRFDGAGDSTGTINHTSTTDKLWDANWHHVAVKYSIVASKTTLNIYVDGVYESSHTATGACAIASTNRRIVFGGTRNAGWTDNSYCLPGALAIIGVYKYTGTPNLIDIYGAGMDGDVGDSIATRLTSLAGFVNVSIPTSNDVSPMTLSGQDLEGTSYLDAVQDIAVTERGVFYIDRFNNAQFRGQLAKSTSASVTVTIDASKDLTGDFSISVDDALFANVVTASGPVGSYTTLDSTSVAAIGEVYDSFTSLAGTEVRLQNSAIDRLAERISDAARLSKISIDLLTTPNSIVSTVLELVPFDRVSVTNLPTAYTYVSSFDGFVEGWELAINDQSYTCSLDLSPVI